MRVGCTPDIPLFTKAKSLSSVYPFAFLLLLVRFAFRYPFFGLQFHPEKALFEHCPQSRIPHFFLSVLPSVYISAFLGLLARQSTNAFKDEKEKFDKVAFAFTPTRTAVYGQSYSFEQVYLFPQSKREEMQQQLRTLRQQTQRQDGEEYLAAVAAEEA